ncbi:hypothetical protein [Alkalihalobacillus sp. BA299]|uniref:hypothetical protein n=1 Tax=Alkalihalobacillus sp. BA299 TaxID=2815938 RepID=UPI001ADCEA14|nr:hypothetical protein [Alkalihalobacillus sp. BA299]
MNIDIREIYTEYEMYNLKLIPAIEKIIDDFRKQRENEALKLLIEAIEGINWSIKVLYHTKDILKKYDVVFDENEINPILNEVTEAIKDEDYVLIADLLEYELLENFQTWIRGIKLYLDHGKG